MFKLCRPTWQNKAIKLVFDGKNLAHVTPYYSKLNILKLQDKCKDEVAKIVFQFSRDNLLPHFKTYFLKQPKYLP